MTSPEEVIDAVRDGLAAKVSGRLLGVYVHGSLVTGDFAPDRSDLDLLTVLDTDPDQELLGSLAALHADLDSRYPRWAGRVEVEYASLDAIRDAASGAAGSPGHVIARVSPGERLHLLAAIPHRLLGWFAVRDHGRCLSASILTSPSDFDDGEPCPPARGRDDRG